MDLNWKHQRMTVNLRNKLKALGASYASPRQTLNITRTAIIPSLAYSFAVPPCIPSDYIIWDNLISRTIKHKFKLWKSTATAMIREDTFCLNTPSVHLLVHSLVWEPNYVNHPSIHPSIYPPIHVKALEHLLFVSNTTDA